jgi:hypothetical protein
LEKKENVVENDAEEKNDVVEKEEDFKEKKEYFGGDSGEGECCGE